MSIRKVTTVILAALFFGIFLSVRVYAAGSDFTVKDGVLIKYGGSGGNVVIPDGVTAIGDYAFCGCTGIQSIEIPAGVVKIEENAFNGCTSLTRVAIPATMKEIGRFAFNGCSNLENIEIPDSVADIGGRAFFGAPWLENQRNGSDDGLVVINHILIDGEKASGNVVIPSTVQKIGELAFAQCEGLTDITIPDGITEIGYGAFVKCAGLTKVKIPDSVTQIGEGAFSESGLTEVSLPNGLAVIDKLLFQKCAGLTKIEIPDSVTQIGECAFEDSGLTEISLPKGLTVIASKLFRNCANLKSVTIPDSVTKIAYHAFYKCKSLSDVTIPDSVTSIGRSAFYECESLTSVSLPSKMTVLENHTFFSCTALADIDIPAGITQIGGFALYNTPWIKQKLAESSDSLVIVNDILIDGQRASGNVIIPDTVKKIAGWAFYDNRSLTGVTLGNITEIAYGTFCKCKRLTAVEIPASVTIIGEQAFACSGLTAVTFPDNVKEIGCGAVMGCPDLTQVTIKNKTAAVMSAAGNGMPNIFGVRGGSNSDVNVYSVVDYKGKSIQIRGYENSTAYELASYMNDYKGDYGYQSVQFIKLDSADAKALLAKVKVTSALNIRKGKSGQIKVTLPSGLVKSQIKITYKTDNQKVAITNKSGKIFGKERGSAGITVTVRLQDGTKKDFYTKVKVK